MASADRRFPVTGNDRVTLRFDFRSDIDNPDDGKSRAYPVRSSTLLTIAEFIERVAPGAAVFIDFGCLTVGDLATEHLHLDAYQPDENHPDPEPPIDLGWFVCDCGVRCRTVQGLRAHERSHRPKPEPTFDPPPDPDLELPPDPPADPDPPANGHNGHTAKTDRARFRATSNLCIRNLHTQCVAGTCECDCHAKVPV